MKKLLTAFLLTYFIYSCTAQIAVNSIPNGIFFAKTFSKDITVYYAKEFLMKQVLGISSEVVKFDIEPLAAANSGELTSVAYNCPDRNKWGMLLGFYNEFSQNYGFKNIEAKKAIVLLNKIDSISNAQLPYLTESVDYNNVYFNDEDMTFLLYRWGSFVKIRVFWNSFDAEWDAVAFRRTKKRLAQNLD